MILMVYDNLNEFAEDLIKVSVLDEKNFNIFVEETAKEKLSVCFFDNEKGEFTCYIWFDDITTTKEDEVVSAIADSWAFYCKITDEKLLTYIKTSCLLTNAVLKSLKAPESE